MKQTLCLHTLCFFALCLAVNPPAWGNSFLQLDTTYQQWEWEQSTGGFKTDLDQFTLRALVGVELRSNLLLEASGAVYGSEWTGFMAEGNTEKISDVSDTRARLSWTFRRSLLIRAGVSLPTGKTALAKSEFPLSQTLASRVLELQTNRLGEGLAVDLGAAYAFRISGGISAALGAAYLYKDSYRVIEGTPEFRPGDQISVSAGVDLASTVWLWRVNARAIVYGEDEFESDPFQQEGPRGEVQTTLLRRWPKTSVWGSLFYIQFMKAKSRSGSTLVDEAEKRRGDEAYAELGIRRQLSSRAYGSLRAGARYTAANGYDLGGAERGTVELLLGTSASPLADIELTVGASKGTLRDPNPLLGNVSESSLQGFNGGLRLNYKF